MRGACSRRMRTHVEWNVAMRGGRMPRGRTRSSTRCRISSAALLVKVTARTLRGWMPSTARRYATRWAMTRVFPLPAPARTSTGPRVEVTASRCASLSGARRASRTAPGTGMGGNDITATEDGPPPRAPSAGRAGGRGRGRRAAGRRTAQNDAPGRREHAERHRHVVRCAPRDLDGAREGGRGCRGHGEPAARRHRPASVSGNAGIADADAAGDLGDATAPSRPLGLGAALERGEHGAGHRLALGQLRLLRVAEIEGDGDDDEDADDERDDQELDQGDPAHSGAVYRGASPPTKFPDAAASPLRLER